MKQGWQIKKLGEVCDIINGRNQKAVECADGQYPIYGSGGSIMGFASDYLCEIGTTIIGRKGSINNPIYIDTPFWNVDTAFGISSKPMMSSKYVYYFCKSFDFSKLNKGTTLPSLVKKDLLLIDIPVPSLSEQQRIVSLLDAEFAKIDALKANAEKNLQNAKDLFQTALKKELEPKEGWMVKTLKEIGLTQTGTTPKTSVKDNYGNFIPFIKPADVNIDGLGNLNYDNEGLSEQGAKCGRVFEANSILMVCIGATIGKVGYAKQKVSSNQQINVLTPNDGYDCKFLYYCMASPRFQFEVIKEGESAKATLPIINKSKWECLTIAYPSKPIQQSIVARLDALSEKCKTLQANYEKTIVLCNDLKQALLKKAFNGEI